ncbi:SGNH/GDSL hydrolase family protein [Saccharothrix syringae]|uniref:SGNH/GDSL hydrolase family protein n=1 Tax=Saccharothrix syringae TaxID=103733 RepID=A0A5Q0H6F9_SACSY|nr:SGNH/GDSL hydrolase family protein [Saccharothrix syringae]QFZ21524.1 SGNH/GDSL hydrolase family protein [Saccharothrix syringae]
MCAALPAALAVALTAPAAQAAAPVDYVALGDSYSSGTGAPPYNSGGCYRSSRGYAQLWADTHAVSSFKYAACGGATTDSMTDQFASLDAGTDLVTITIGGNDVGFASTMITCVTGSDSSCTGAVDAGVEKARTVLPAKLDATYATIRTRAPNATVVVLGYPRLVEPNGTCMNATKRAALNRGADDLHAVISARAAAAGVRYVDARTHFAGHGACGSSPWINQFSLLRLVESFHPNATGYRSGYLALLNGVTG